MNKNWQKYHRLKIEERFLERILSGQKRFEIRKDDRDFQVGDWMYLSCGHRQLACQIIYKSTFEQKDGYCVLGFIIGKEEETDDE